MDLVGREAECCSLARLLADARNGYGRSLVLRGEAGIGKTALLDHLAGSAEGCMVVRAVGVESESEFALSALAELTRPLFGYLGELPAAQAGVLAAAAARGGPTEAVDRRTVYAATLGLLAAAAADRPLLCLVDDAHWLDRASAEALLFTARRLLADAVLIVFAARDVPGFEAPGVPELPVRGLDQRASATLLARAGEVSPLVAARLATLTLGNPLALIELPRVLAAEPDTGSAGPAGLAEPLPTTQRLERAFAAQVGAVTAEQRQALVICAAAGTAELDVLGRALAAAGLDLAALDAATALGLVRAGAGTVTFRHPLIRSAVYAQAGPGLRRRAHLALAQARTAPEEADRRAWHLAHAAVGPDPAVADALVSTAGRARLRGGVVAQATALERAASLTADPAVRGARLAAAAAAWTDAGAVEHAGGLLEWAAAVGAGTPAVRLAVLSHRGYQAMLRGEAADVFDALVAEADRAGPADRLAAGRVLSIAMNAPLSRWDVRGILELCERAMRLAAPDGPDPVFPKAAVRLAYARVLAGLPGGAELARRSMPACEQREAHGACAELAEVLTWIEEYGDARRMVDRDIDEARAVGDVTLLAYALPLRAGLELRVGRLLAAYSDALEGIELAEMIGQRVNTSYAVCALALVEAALGRWDDCAGHAAAALERSPGNAGVESRARQALGQAALAARFPERAVAELGRADALLRAGGVVEPAAVPVAADLAEAQLRLGQPAEAERVLDRLDAAVASTGRRGQRAAALRGRALIARGAAAERLFTETLAAYATVDAPLERARAELCLGQWLRRTRRRRDARRQLAAALETFDAAGAKGWADQARHELSALGMRRQTGASQPGGHRLTPQEWRIAWAAAQGQTSREIATQVFLSTRTVDYHLGIIYRKLGVRSRRELIRTMGADGQPRDAFDAGA